MMTVIYGPLPCWAFSYACCDGGRGKGCMRAVSEDVDRVLMQKCVDLSRLCVDEVPIAALVHHPEHGVIALERSQSLERCDPSGHAEIVALRSASQRMQNHRLPSCTLYTTLEPCPMCFYAIMQARIARVVFAASDTKIGMLSQNAYKHTHAQENHHFCWSHGILQKDAQRMLLDFFLKKRER